MKGVLFHLRNSAGKGLSGTLITDIKQDVEVTYI